METKEIGLEIVQIRLIQDRIVYNEKPIHSPQDAVEILGNEIKDYDREVLCVLNLDAHGVVQNANIVSMGTVNQTVSSHFNAQSSKWKCKTIKTGFIND